MHKTVGLGLVLLAGLLGCQKAPPISLSQVTPNTYYLHQQGPENNIVKIWFHFKKDHKIHVHYAQQWRYPDVELDYSEVTPQGKGFFWLKIDKVTGVGQLWDMAFGNLPDPCIDCHTVPSCLKNGHLQIKLISPSKLSFCNSPMIFEKK